MPRLLKNLIFLGIAFLALFLSSVGLVQLSEQIILGANSTTPINPDASSVSAWVSTANGAITTNFGIALAGYLIFFFVMLAFTLSPSNVKAFKRTRLWTLVIVAITFAALGVFFFIGHNMASWFESFFASWNYLIIPALMYIPFLVVVLLCEPADTLNTRRSIFSRD